MGYPEAADKGETDDIGKKCRPLIKKSRHDPFHHFRDGEIEHKEARSRAPGELYRAALPRDFVQQPPLIPHTIRGYMVTMNFNKCMDCHAWSRARETGATKVSLTHFRDRDGKELPNVAPRRYFCMQCHVPQTEAKPLVDNTFRPATGLK